MRFLLLCLFCVASRTAITTNPFDKMHHTRSQKPLTYLALGDSYTIGEHVAAADNFPNQVVSFLQSDSITCEPAKIIAKTGWTTDELDNAISHAQSSNEIKDPYDFVTLLIGVNDQYREDDFSDYQPAFEALLKKAIHFAGDRPEHVVVVSIPDWGITPFAEGRDHQKIATEIDAYNKVNKLVSANFHVGYVDITPWTRQAVNDPTLVTTDGLHPSGKEYTRWAEKIAAIFRSKM